MILPLFQGFFLFGISLDLTPANNGILRKSGCLANRGFQKPRIGKGKRQHINTRFYPKASIEWMTHSQSANLHSLFRQNPYVFDRQVVTGGYWQHTLCFLSCERAEVHERLVHLQLTPNIAPIRPAIADPSHPEPACDSNNEHKSNRSCICDKRLGYCHIK